MAKKRNAAPTEQTRTVTVSVRHPVSVTIIVRRADEDGDWEIVGVRDWHANITPRSAMECMDDRELMELDERANAAKDDE